MSLPTSQFSVFVTRKLPEIVEVRLRALFDAKLNADDKPLTRHELVEAVKTARVLVPTLTDRIDEGVLSQAGPQLRLIASFGAGVDHIDLEAARARSIVVTNTPGVLTEDTADIAMALIFGVLRRLREGANCLRQPSSPWAGWAPTGLLGHRLYGKRLGIIGMGQIGTAVARRAWACGLQIHYHNRRRAAEEVEQALQATYWEDLDQMLARMDVISVNCPLTSSTYHLLSAQRLALLKPTTFIVNTARGEIIDEAALTGLLEAGKLAGAGLDVFEHEPKITAKLLALPNVVALPHMGSATIEGRIEMGEKVIVNIKTFMDGHAPPDRVFPAMF